MFYALGASFCTAVMFVLTKYFWWEERAAVLMLMLAVTCGVLFVLYTLPDNVSLTGLFFR